MKVNNEFDNKLEAQKENIPKDVLDAAVFVTDTMDLCVASADAIFDTKSTPELALEIYDRVIEKMYLDKND